MKIGYARVSTGEQNLDLQVDALRGSGCEALFTDRGKSGADFSRPGLDRALAQLGPGDTLVVWRLDRLGRSLGKLVDLIHYLGKQEIQFQSLTETINTQSSGGTLIFHMMAAMAEFERSLISERTRAGLEAARSRGVQLGRKQVLSAAQRTEVLALLASESIKSVARKFEIHPRTVYRIRHEHQRVKHLDNTQHRLEEDS
ncbi:recombinase family protein [Burkholderia territorii]|uniref:recombinase family protein n=1 Tax=Burkholderia territorii TaxID=1503055 RepID=UPI0012DACFAA|nr:recombinase family protein [Burkholderia territorii]